METYSILRQFADSWGMLAMLLFFLGVIAYALIGRKQAHSDAANSIFRNEDRPAPDEADVPSSGAGKERDT